MLAKIIGWIWILIGVFSLIKPLFLKNKLLKKGKKTVKKILFGIAVVLGGMLITVSFKMSGILAWIVLIIGIISIIKGVVFLKGEATEKITVWLEKQPVKFFQITAVVYILIGLIILLGAK